jgi:integrase
MAAGLLDYREGLPATGQLFPTLRGAGADNKLGWYLGQRFTEYRRKCGVVRPRLAFHSFRKQFATAMDRAGVPQADISAVLGHSRGFSLNVYSSGPGLKRLQELVERVEYEGIT